jgi:diguanylate cyclase (GGDEF)-like protein
MATMPGLPSHPAARISLAYAAIALPWVLVTDLLVREVIPAGRPSDVVNALKGAGFVLVTAGVLYAALKRWTGTLSRARNAAADGEARLEALLGSLDDLIFIVDADLRFVEILGPLSDPQDRERMLGLTAREIFGAEVGARYELISRQVLEGEVVEMDWTMGTAPPLFSLHADVTSMHFSLAPLRERGGRITGIVGIGRDTSRLRAAERHISFLTDYDALTGLPNRSLMEARLGQAINAADQGGHRFAMHLLDIDRFRDINDSLGYVVGDEMLVEVARRLENIVDEGDTVARLSGDDFVVIQAHVASHIYAAEMAEAIVGTFDEPFSSGGQTLRASCSIGVVLYPDDAATPLDLLRCADAAMYAAKGDPNHQWAFYEPAMGVAVSERLAMANELREAIEADALDVAYQPIVRAGDGRVIAVEALARWQSPTWGPIPPVVFIPLAEQVGLIDDLGRCVRTKAYRWLVRAHAEGFTDLQIEVNVSPHHFAAGHIRRLLEEAALASLDPRFIVIEITESALVEVHGRRAELLTELVDHGFQLAVDDFGTGYSSLAYLARLPVRVIKVAQEFVRSHHNESDRVVIEAAIAMAQRLGYQTIAEGVETAAEAAYLEQVGIDAHQGYHFGRPVPADEAMEHLRRVGTPASS